MPNICNRFIFYNNSILCKMAFHMAGQGDEWNLPIPNWLWKTLFYLCVVFSLAFEMSLNFKCDTQKMFNPQIYWHLTFELNIYASIGIIKHTIWLQKHHFIWMEFWISICFRFVINLTVFEIRIDFIPLASVHTIGHMPMCVHVSGRLLCIWRIKKNKWNQTNKYLTHQMEHWRDKWPSISNICRPAMRPAWNAGNAGN